MVLYILQMHPLEVEVNGLNMLISCEGIHVAWCIGMFR